MATLLVNPSHLAHIEDLLGRPLTKDELLEVASADDLSEAQHEIIRQFGASPLGMAYLATVMPGVRDAARTIGGIVNEEKWITEDEFLELALADKLTEAHRETVRRVRPRSVPLGTVYLTAVLLSVHEVGRSVTRVLKQKGWQAGQAWCSKAGLGRWRFRILPVDGEDAASTVRRCVDAIVANAEPFGRVVSRHGEPTQLVLDAFVETEEGRDVASPGATVTFVVVQRAVELTLVLDVDIHSFVTKGYIDNSEFAAMNAPRLEHLLSLFRNVLHAELIESNGLLSADERGFTGADARCRPRTFIARARSKDGPLGALAASDRSNIEKLLGRQLTDEDLRRVPSGDALTETQVEIISYLMCRHVTFSMFYLGAIVPGIQFAEASRIAHRIFNEPRLVAVTPWSLQAGVGRWRFRIVPPADPLETVRRMVSFLQDNAAPFGHVNTLYADDLPAVAVLDVTVQTKTGKEMLASAAMITWTSHADGIDLLFELDVDIYAEVTWKSADNATLAAANAPRLAQFLTMLRDRFDAQFIASDGLLPGNERGFTRNAYDADSPPNAGVLEPSNRAPLEQTLGRPVVDDELRLITLRDALPAAQRAVVADLSRYRAVCAMLYARAVVSDALIPEAFRIVEVNVMGEIDLAPSHRSQIEDMLGRMLTESELRCASSVERLSDAHRNVIHRLGPRPIGAMYLISVVPDIRGSIPTLIAIAEEKNWIPDQAWSQEPGLGRWRFRILPADREGAASTVRRCIDVIVANAAPFGRVVPRRGVLNELPAELVFDVFVETKQGPRVLSAAAAIAFSIADTHVELVLTVDVDIYAFVTKRVLENAMLAAKNAPRLKHVLLLLRNELHAELVASDGVLPTNEHGFSARRSAI